MELQGLFARSVASLLEKLELVVALRNGVTPHPLVELWNLAGKDFINDFAGGGRWLKRVTTLPLIRKNCWLSEGSQVKAET